MTTFYQAYLNQARHWYADSPLREFLHWWGTELKNLLPPQWRQRFFRDKSRLLIVADTAVDGPMTLWQGHDENWNRLSVEPAGDWSQRIHQLLNSDSAPDTDIIYVLPAGKALVRQIQLPAAARDNLDNVLKYELDRFVPFNPDQVRFAWRLEKNPEAQENDTIAVQVAVIPETEFDKHLRVLKDKGLSVDAMDVARPSGTQADSPPETVGVNLLPREIRRQKTNARTQLNVILAFILIGLLGLAMWNSLANKRAQLAAVESQSKKLLTQARQAKQLQQQLQQAIVAANFIQQQKSHLPAAVPVLAELTERIPDDTFLQRVLLNRERLEISGLSDNANKLVSLLNDSAIWYAPEVKGAVQPDPRHPGKEKFTLYMSTQPPAEGDDAASS